MGEIVRFTIRFCGRVQTSPARYNSELKKKENNGKKNEENENTGKEKTAMFIDSGQDGHVHLAVKG